jgi:tRNA pseudouridine38-40 synthase
MREDIQSATGEHTRARRTLKCIIEFDGTDFHGWQVQSHERTVQGEIEEALKTLLQEEVHIVGAGRTDTGVHALGQVAHFQTDSAMEISAVYNGLNSLTPEDIVIHHVEEVPSSFHARFDATSRRYMYRLTQRQEAIGRRYAWFVRFPLDLSEMEKGTGYLQGEHSFRSFCATESQVSHHTCTVSDVNWEHNEHRLTFSIQADRFLQHMVRTIVGSLVEVGRGRWSAEEIDAILKAEDRRRAGPTAPPHGLYLAEVSYT